MKLIIAEKQSVGEAIAKVLHITNKKDGYMEGRDAVVSWCRGHLITTARPDAYGEQYEKWGLDTLPILPNDWQYIPLSDGGAKKQLKTLAALMKRPDVDTIVEATDAGREGELIFRHVYHYCKCKKPIQRLWVSSLEESEIRQGLERLRSGADYNRLYDAALCREKADWLVGFNATRLFSTLYNRTLPIGRVITPTLAIMVQREQKISDFQKEPYYTVELDCGSFRASSDRFPDQSEAEKVCTACKGSAEIVSLERRERSVQPPRLFDLTALQREANRLFGYTAMETLDCLQALYEKRLATYPRTDSQYLTESTSATVPQLVEMLLPVFPFAASLNHPPDTKRITDNARVSDHHGLIPTANAAQTELAALPTNERNILTLIAARLFCALENPHIYAETVATLDCGGYSFIARGREIVAMGWKGVEQSFRASIGLKPESGSEQLPSLSEKQRFEGISVSVKEHYTSPPKHFTDETILSAMESAGIEDMPEDAERKGIGTPATRAETIERLIQKDFVRRDKKSLIPTEKGTALVSVLPDVVKSPLLTAEWETKLKQVERGELSANSFMDGITGFIAGLVDTYKKQAEGIGNNFPFRETREEIGKCPRCGASVYAGKKGFHCSRRDCRFSLWQDDNFFKWKHKKITKEIAVALLKEGRVKLTGLFSEKTGKTYDATVILADTGGQYVNFKMEFEAKKGKP